MPKVLIEPGEAPTWIQDQVECPARRFYLDPAVRLSRKTIHDRYDESHDPTKGICYLGKDNEPEYCRESVTVCPDERRYSQVKDNHSDCKQYDNNSFLNLIIHALMYLSLP